MAVIELDCAPDDPRPGELIEGVIAGLDITATGEPSTMLGCWTWHFDIDGEVWERDIIPVIQDRIRQLFFDEQIRYGAWR